VLAALGRTVLCRARVVPCRPTTCCGSTALWCDVLQYAQARSTASSRLPLRRLSFLAHCLPPLPRRRTSATLCGTLTLPLAAQANSTTGSVLKCALSGSAGTQALPKVSVGLVVGTRKQLGPMSCETSAPNWRAPFMGAVS
jgi:hypothetical protein